jgi:hypothetical protein
MSDYIATEHDYTIVEHNVETGETTSRVMTQEEVDTMMQSFAGFTEDVIVETEVTDELP